MLYLYRSDKGQILDLVPIDPFGMTTEIWKSTGLYNQPGGASGCAAHRAAVRPQTRWKWVVGDCQDLLDLRFVFFLLPDNYLVYVARRRGLPDYIIN